MSATDQSTGLLLVGHGTRSDIGTRQFLNLARSLAERLAPLPVEPAFLELQQPDINAAVTRLVFRGIKRLVTMPLLLFAAGHAKRDIPEQVRATLAGISDREPAAPTMGRRSALQKADEIEEVQAHHLGCHPNLVELARRRMEEALVPGSPSDRSTCLLLVARGSHDESATAEMQEFSRLRQQAVPDVPVEFAFLAMARPLLAQKLVEIGCRGYQRVVVQPHFLFHGELVESIAARVGDLAAQHPKQEWLIAPPLADYPGRVTSATELIQNVILDRCYQAGIRVVAPGADD